MSTKDKWLQRNFKILVCICLIVACNKQQVEEPGNFIRTDPNVVYDNSLDHKLIAPGNILNYETGLPNDDNQYVGIVAPRSESVRASTEYARDGLWSLRSELNYGETTSVGIRAECNQHYYVPNEIKVPVVERGKRRFYGFSCLIDPTPGHYDYDRTSEVIMQQKDVGSNGVSGTAYFQLLTGDGNFKFWHQNKDGIRRRRTIAPYEKGIWYDFVLEILPSYNENGVLKLFYKKATDIEYTQVLDWEGSTLRSENTPLYTKWGMYKSTWASETASKKRVIYHDNIRYGESFVEADPALVPPLPVVLHDIAIGDNNQMLLNWDISDEADFLEYRIYRSESNDGAFELLSEGLKENSFVDTVPDIKKQYFYLITVVDKTALESSRSNIRSTGIVAATTIKLTDIKPVSTGFNNTGRNSKNSEIIGISNANGRIVTITPAEIPVIPDSNPELYNRPSESNYVVQVKHLEAAGYLDVKLNFELALTTSLSDGILVFKTKSWCVDRGNDGGENNEHRSFNADETIIFEIKNISVDKPDLNVEFIGFSEIGFTNNSKGAFDSQTGTATGYGSGSSAFHIESIGFDFIIKPFP